MINVLSSAEIHLSLKKNKTLGINERGSTFLNRFDNIMVNPIEINNEKEYVVTTPDRKQATLLNLLTIEMNCKHGREKTRFTKKTTRKYYINYLLSNR